MSTLLRRTKFVVWAIADTTFPVFIGTAAKLDCTPGENSLIIDCIGAILLWVTNIGDIYAGSKTPNTIPAANVIKGILAFFSIPESPLFLR